MEKKKQKQRELALKEKVNYLTKLNSNNYLTQVRNEKGITLIALVVTIVILLILAGVTLGTVLSDGGLIDKTKEAIGEHEKAQEKEQEELGQATGTISDLIEELEKTLVTSVTTTEHETVYGKDRLGNPVVIPGGFRFAGQPDDTVEDGIIIADDEGNEFVWIPVSNIDGDSNASNNPNDKNLIKLKNNKKVEITLGRYSFSGSTSKLEQSGENHEKAIPVRSNCYENGDSEHKRPEGAEGAKDLAGFVESVKTNHGYYLARYEASYKSGDSIDNYKIFTKPSINNSTTKMDYTSGTLWNCITQKNAAKISRNMYSEEGTCVESDLVNGYAWDTAIVYIQAMGNEGYAIANRITTGNSTLLNTGATKDEKCNIFDLAGNLMEWDTEFLSPPGDGR